jgi:hypothetical protein
MKKTFSVFLAIAAVATVGCSDDDPTTVEVAPQARVRYFNASPDAPASTEAVFVDKVENAFTFRRVPFRGHSGEYQAVNAGARQFRVFRAIGTATVDTAQVVVIDTTFSLEADRRYTIMQVGNSLTARGTAGAASVVVFEDTLPETVTAGTVALRVYNALPTAPTATVAVAPRTSATATGATAATIPGVAYLGRSAYVNVPALAAADTSAYYRFIVTSSAGAALANNFPTTMGVVPNGTTLSAGGAAAVAATATAPPQTALAGVRQSGSVLSAFITPAVTGTAASTPTTVLVPDRPPTGQ